LHPRDRSEFLQTVAEQLRGVEIGDGVVSRTLRDLQKQFLSPSHRSRRDAGNGSDYFLTPEKRANMVRQR
jgi:hypothetical protein